MIRVHDISMETIEGRIEFPVSRSGNSKEPFLDARLILSSGPSLDGVHSIDRDSSRTIEVLRSFWCHLSSCCAPKKTFKAFGPGIFSRQGVVIYRGGFHENKLQSNVDEISILEIPNTLRIIGGFHAGRPHGVCKEYRYDRRKRQFLPVSFREWIHGVPQTGGTIFRGGQAHIDGDDSPQVSPRAQKNRSPQGMDRPLLQDQVEEQPFDPDTFQIPVYHLPDRNTFVHRRVSESAPLPDIEENALLRHRLNNPNDPITVEQLIRNLHLCLRYGQETTVRVQHKECVVILGNTGSGKSTLANALLGFEMEEIQGKTHERLYRVKGEGEIMRIGHGRLSQTFVPQAEPVTGSPLTIVDCPGYSDNRGAEINIANAVNIKQVLNSAKSVRFVVLLSYHSLMADRAKAVASLLKIIADLFGSLENLKQHKESILIGITMVPLGTTCEELKAYLKDDPAQVIPAMNHLVDCIFTYDPMNRSIADRLSVPSLREKILGSASICEESASFQTVLTPSDEKELETLCAELERKITHAIEEQRFTGAAETLRLLQSLDVIGHPRVEDLILETTFHIQQIFLEKIRDFKSYTLSSFFQEAIAIYTKICEGVMAFDTPFQEVFHLDELEAFFTTCYQRWKVVKEQEIAAKRLAQHVHNLSQVAESIETLRQKMDRFKSEQKDAFNILCADVERLKQNRDAFVETTTTRTATVRDHAIHARQQEIELATAPHQDQERASIASDQKRFTGRFTEHITRIQGLQHQFNQHHRTQVALLEAEFNTSQEQFEQELIALTEELQKQEK